MQLTDKAPWKIRSQIFMDCAHFIKVRSRLISKLLDLGTTEKGDHHFW